MARWSNVTKMHEEAARRDRERLLEKIKQLEAEITRLKSEHTEKIQGLLNTLLEKDKRIYKLSEREESDRIRRRAPRMW